MNPRDKAWFKERVGRVAYWARRAGIQS